MAETYSYLNFPVCQAQEKYFRMETLELHFEEVMRGSRDVFWLDGSHDPVVEVEAEEVRRLTHEE